MSRIRIFFAVIVLVIVLVGFTSCKPNVSEGDGDSKTERVSLYPIWKLTPKGEQWGYMDEKGAVVISPQYEDAGFFTEEGTAVVQHDGARGIISLQGQYLLKPIYDQLQIYPKDRWVGVRDGSWGEMVGRDGKAVYETRLGIFPMKDAGARIQEYVDDRIMEGYIDEAGTVTVEPQFLKCTDYTENRAAVAFADGTFGIIDQTGVKVAELAAGDIGPASEAMIAFRKPGDENALWGYADVNGKVVIKAQYNEVRGFDQGLAVVGQKQKGELRFGVIDNKGKYLLRPKYGYIKDLGNGFFAVAKDLPGVGGDNLLKKAIFNAAGNRLTDYDFYDISACTADTLSVSDGNETWVLDSAGENISTMPRIAGLGTIRQVGSLLVSQVEGELAYFTLQGSLVWQSPWTAVLKDAVRYDVHKFRPDIGLVTHYPSFAGIPSAAAQELINQDVAKTFIGEGEGSVLENGIPTMLQRVDFELILNKDILTIVKKTDRKTPDGMLLSPLETRVHYDLRNGSRYTLGHLFRENSNWSQALAIQVSEQLAKLKQAGGSYTLETVPPVLEEREFYPGRYGLQLYYDGAELGGVPGERLAFEIPYTAILKEISTEGEFWNGFLKQDM